MASGLMNRNAVTGVALAGLVVAMIGVAYASVPLYRLFCQVTGFGGTTQVATSSPDRIVDRVVTVRFNSDVNPKLPWRFNPDQRSVKLKLGEERLAYFSATNLSDKTVTGTATFNVTPAKAGAYFFKVNCFCFTETTLKPGETVRMPVSFYVDPDLVNDRNLDDITEITLSYTFFRLNKPGSEQTAAASRADEGTSSPAIN